jgi:hypothetical protein
VRACAAELGLHRWWAECRGGGQLPACASACEVAWELYLVGGPRCLVVGSMDGEVPSTKSQPQQTCCYLMSADGQGWTATSRSHSTPAAMQQRRVSSFSSCQGLVLPAQSAVATGYTSPMARWTGTNVVYASLSHMSCRFHPPSG